MTRGLYLSFRDAEEMASSITSNTGLVTDITEYEEKNGWYYVTAYDYEGYVVDSVDTAEEALELIGAYQKDFNGED